ncbi:MAG: tail tape measure protein [Sphingopyxis sp.]|nr:tail tape measure protein [Sphingopyxis sp.]
MTDRIDDADVGVRIDTRGFTADVQAMRATIEQSLGDGAERAGQRIESALLRAARTGSFGFEDLRRVALATMADIARASLSSGLSALTGSNGAKGQSGGGLLGLAGSLAVSLLGAPGRATGGPVAPGRAYRVGENGPELFVPTSAGRIETGVARGSGRDIRITVNVGGTGGDPSRMAASGRQIAQAVRRAMQAAED